MLRQADIDARKEVRLPATSPLSRSGYFFADIGIYRLGKLVALVECKRRERELRGRQGDNYRGCGLEYMVAGFDNIDAAFQWCLAHSQGVRPA